MVSMIITKNSYITEYYNHNIIITFDNLQCTTTTVKKLCHLDSFIVVSTPLNQIIFLLLT